MNWVLLACIVCSIVLADVSQSHEMKPAGEQSVDALGLARILRTILARDHLILAVVFMPTSVLAFMGLVKVAPLVPALLACAATLAFETLMARFVLRDGIWWQLGTGRFAGAERSNPGRA